MKLNNRFLYGILSILLAAIVAFIAIPAVSSKTNGTIQIVRIENDVPKGNIITKEDVTLIDVGRYNLPPDVATKTEDVIGTYAAVTLVKGDYILSDKVSSLPLSSDISLNNIPDGKTALSITAKTLASGLSDKLQTGDIIRLYHYNNKDELVPVKDIPELRYLKVLGISDAEGNAIDHTSILFDEEEHRLTATITVLASPEQAMLLTRYENEGILHAALISRGNDALALELLTRQEELLLELYTVTQPDAEETSDISSTETEVTIE